MVLRSVQNRFPTAVALAAWALCWCPPAALADAPAKTDAPVALAAGPAKTDAPAKADTPAKAAAPRNDYPTVARVEYVEECIARNGGNLADLYKCSCAIDRMADRLTYDDFVEAGTFARYATLPGEGGGIFRDPERARERAKLYRSVEADAYRICGLKVATPSR